MMVANCDIRLKEPMARIILDEKTITLSILLKCVNFVYITLHLEQTLLHQKEIVEIRLFLISYFIAGDFKCIDMRLVQLSQI